MSQHSPGTSNPSQRIPGLVGRSREIALLEGALSEAERGLGRVVIIGGEPGVGKTRLAEEVARMAESAEGSVVWGRCYHGSGAPAFWPWIQVLRTLLSDRDTSALSTILGNGAMDVAQLLPEIREKLPDLDALPQLESEAARFRLFDSVSASLIRLAGKRPRVILLDDLQWADHPSLLLLEFLSIQLRDASLLVVGTYRDVEIDPDHPLDGVLATLERLPSTEHVKLRGLEQSEVGQLMSSLGSANLTADLVASIAEHTDGNPFFIQEIARLLATRSPADRTDLRCIEVPQAVKSLIRQRLKRLPSECQALLTAASVIGRDFSLPFLEAATELDEGEILDALDEAEMANVVRKDGGAFGRFRFVHDVTRDAIYQDLGRATRTGTHLRVFHAMERLYKGDTQSHLAELAHHAYEALPAGDPDTAIRYGIQAGDDATRRLAWEAAIQHYSRALQLIELVDPVDDNRKTRTLLELGDTYWKIGDAASAQRSFAQATELARTRNAPEDVARATIGFAGGENPAFKTASADIVDLLDEALIALGDRDASLRVWLLTIRGLYEPDGPDRGRRRIEYAEEAIATARRGGDPATHLDALVLAMFAYSSPDDGDKRLEIMSEIQRLTRESGVARSKISDIQLNVENSEWIRRGDVVTHDRELERQRREVAQFRVPGHAAVFEMKRIMRLLMEGRFAEADALIEETRPIARRAFHEGFGDAWLTQYKFVILRERGDAATIVPYLHELIETDVSWERYWLCRLALLHSDEERFERAREIFDQIARHDFEDIDFSGDWIVVPSLAAEICSFVRDRRRGEILYSLLRPYAHLNTTYLAGIDFHGSVAYYLGLMASLLERWSDAEQHFDDALAMHARMNALPWIARTQVAFARMFLKRGAAEDHQRALDLAKSAREIAENLGMVLLASQAERLIADVSLHEPRTKAGANSSGLTPREIEVLRLIAQGYRNREIAEELFISRKTADNHVSNILGKLGVSSRTEAVHRATQLGVIQTYAD